MAITLVLSGSIGWGTVYTGSQSYTGSGADTGFAVQGSSDGWSLYTEMSWLVHVDHPDAPSMHSVYYEYTVTVQKYSLSHIILELSANFGLDDIAHVQVNGEDHLLYTIGTHESGPGNPEMPEALYGIKFDDLDGGFDAGGQRASHVISFFSSRLPVWGDVYLKGGRGNSAFNEGFTPNDLDPSGPPLDGPFQGHLLVPNGAGHPLAIPEPAMIGLLALGATALLRRRRH